MNLSECLLHGKAIGLERIDSQLLLLHALGRSQGERAWLLAHATDPAPQATFKAFDVLALRRAAGEPLAYIVGRKEFYGLDLLVDARVLVPRPDTEVLVDWALEIALAHQLPKPAPGAGAEPGNAPAPIPALSILDLGTGSGAIALALKQACRHAEIHASDASDAALAVARRNGERLGLPVAWHAGDWWHAFDTRFRFDLAVANPPYIATGDPHLAALRHEPRAALVAHGGGLADIHAIIVGASARLHGAGWLLLEHGFEQADVVCTALRRAGFETVSTRIDLGGQPRVSGGRRGAAAG